MNLYVTLINKDHGGRRRRPRRWRCMRNGFGGQGGGADVERAGGVIFQGSWRGRRWAGRRSGRMGRGRGSGRRRVGVGLSWRRRRRWWCGLRRSEWGFLEDGALRQGVFSVAAFFLAEARRMNGYEKHERVTDFELRAGGGRCVGKGRCQRPLFSAGESGSIQKRVYELFWRDSKHLQ